VVRFSKFTLNINIYNEFVGFFSKLVWRETLFVLYYAKLAKVPSSTLVTFNIMTYEDIQNSILLK